MPRTLDAAAADELVRRVHEGDAEAFRELVLGLQVDLRLFIAARCPRADLIDELLQRTFVTAYERIETYDCRGTLSSWLKGIAFNHLRTLFRERRRRPEVHLDSLDQLIADTAAQLVTDEDEDQALAQAATLERLQHCLARLSPRARSLVERRYRDGLPLNRLAQQFSKTRQAIASTLHRIRRSLRDCIEQAVAP